MGVKDYDLNPDNNTQINGINIAEGCPPSGINNAVRQLMADVKADSDAQNNTASTPATSTSLGPVMPQTGDEDGLELEKDGKLRVRQATATQRGSVLASVTAAAGAVPVGGTDGSLGEDWLKKAMDAANAAMEAADAAGGKNVKSYVIETWKDGSSWYRKWSDGFIEQGGFISIGSPSEVTTTFFVPFTVLPHISLGGVTNYGGSTPDYKRHPLALMTSYFKTQSLFTDNTAVNRGVYWFACGY